MIRKSNWSRKIHNTSLTFYATLDEHELRSLEIEGLPFSVSAEFIEELAMYVDKNADGDARENVSDT